MDDIQFSEFLDESIPLWRNDPVMFFREVLNFEPDEWQAEAARDLAANPKVSIKSGQGVGKTGLRQQYSCGLLPVSHIQESLRQHQPNSSCTMSSGLRFPSG